MRSFKAVIVGFVVVVGVGIALYREVVAPAPYRRHNPAEVHQDRIAAGDPASPVRVPRIDPALDPRAPIDLPPIAHPPPGPVPALSADERALLALE
jgi:hypothetical protein